MTPTEEDYADGTTCNKEYKPGTCCMATVIILGESCTTVNGINAPKWSKSNFAQRFYPHGRCRGVLGIVRSLD